VRSGIEGETLVRDYVLYLTEKGPLDARAPGTLKLRMSAIRARHIAAGLGDPMENMEVPFAILRAYAKTWGGTKKKHPITVAMLLAMESSLDVERKADHLIIMLLATTGFFILGRVSELVGQEGKATGRAGILGAHFEAYLGATKVATFNLADRILITITGSKTDQLNLGCKRLVFPSGHPRLCLLRLAKLAEKHFPTRFTTEACLPLFRWMNGQKILRIQLQTYLTEAAETQGVSATDIGTHSLRHGGASALFAGLRDSDAVKRWGRWKSSAYEGYLWESQEASSVYSRAMVAANLVVR